MCLWFIVDRVHRNTQKKNQGQLGLNLPSLAMGPTKGHVTRRDRAALGAYVHAHMAALR